MEELEIKVGSLFFLPRRMRKTLEYMKKTKMGEMQRDWEKWEAKAKWLLFLIVLEQQTPGFRYSYGLKQYKQLTNRIWASCALSTSIKERRGLQVNLYISSYLNLMSFIRSPWLRCRNFREYLERRK